MLVLSRRKNEIITIGSDIQIKLLDVYGGQARLGIDAPKHLPIMRNELLALGSYQSQQTTENNTENNRI